MLVFAPKTLKGSENVQGFAPIRTMLFAIIDLLLGAKLITLYSIMACGGNDFQKNIYQILNFFSIFLPLFLSCYFFAPKTLKGRRNNHSFALIRAGFLHEFLCYYMRKLSLCTFTFNGVWGDGWFSQNNSQSKNKSFHFIFITNNFFLAYSCSIDFKSNRNIHGFALIRAVLF